ncbi:MAG: ribulose-phosphate 3-epimerase [Flavobacteriaceae bacterium]|nr:ribulose-phosphate 3-epimerase [Flavobacteriaceae bacterium]
MALVSPSVLSADFLHLENDLQMINESDADFFHLDIMDGVFVPNISYGMPLMDAMNKVAQKPLDVHLMIVQPERYFEEFQRLGAHFLSIHYEASVHLHRSVQAIKKLGMKAGVALNPHTPVHVLEDMIEDIDLLLIMSVNPGFGGQSFIPQSLAKIQKAKEMILNKNSSALIEVDGGVDVSNAQDIMNAGADILVAGSAVFKSSDAKKTIRILKNTQ